MTKNKGKLAKAFDEGKLEELLGEDQSVIEEPDAAEYSRSLLQLEDALANPPGFTVPKGFTASVMKHLPEIDLREIKIINLRDFLIPIIIAASLVLSFIFSEPLGFTALLAKSSTLMNSINSSDVQLVFVALSCAGILGTAWLVVSSFFGVRSRRVTEYRYK